MAEALHFVGCWLTHIMIGTSVRRFQILVLLGSGECSEDRELATSFD